MAGFKIEQAKNKQNEIKRNIENKENHLNELKENKEKLMEAGMEIQASDLDEDVKNTTMDLINSELKELAEKGKEASSDMNDDLKELEGIKESTQTTLDSNIKETESLEEKKAFLDKLGLGGRLEHAVSELQNNQKDLEDLKTSILEDENKLMDVAHQLEHV